MTISVSEIQQIGSMKRPDRTLEAAIRRLIGCAGNEPLPCFEDVQRSAAGQPLVVIDGGSSRARVKYLRRSGYRHIRRYIALPSRRQARWLVPDGSGGGYPGGFQSFFTPFSPTSRVLKRVIVRMMNAGVHGRLGQSVLLASKDALPFERLVTDATREEHPTFAFSFGTSGPFKKMTIHVTNPMGESLGYIKVPLGEDSEQRIRDEATMLRHLHEFPALRPHISRLLFAGSCGGSYLLFQSQVTGSPGPSEFTPSHSNFLTKLQSCHGILRSGQSLVRDTARTWETTARHVGSNWRSLAREALRRVALQMDGAQLFCSIAHGDFAPWNMRICNDELRLFDWESATWDAPVAWDKFHFHVQVNSLLKKNRGAADFVALNPTERSVFLLYLLRSASQLLEEGAGAEGIEYRKKLLQHQLSDGFFNGAPS